MRRTAVPALACVVALVGAGAAAPVARAQQPSEPALTERIEALERGQQQILDELRALRRELTARPAPAPVPPAAPQGPEVRGRVFDLGANPVLGEPRARLTLVEFTDYQCPFCSRHVTQTHPSIVEEYIAPGKLRYASLDLPLENLHPLAFKAAEASHCAGEQEKFWEMHDRLFAHQRALEPWSGHAEALGLDVAAFDECMAGDRYAAAVRRDMAEAARAGATGTPSFVLGLTDPNDPTKVEGLSFIRGAQPFAAFKAQIDAALADAGE